MKIVYRLFQLCERGEKVKDGEDITTVHTILNLSSPACLKEQFQAPFNGVDHFPIIP